MYGFNKIQNIDNKDLHNCTIVTNMVMIIIIVGLSPHRRQKKVSKHLQTNLILNANILHVGW